ncbi:dTMP kinase [Arthrobacter sp. Soc17.1.1.1]|jgi:dTMP kinase|uniref:dTMP kinase n=1 Tax=Micrococcaceae TaxID=1268 RepID=UPI00030DD8F4|nr:MULTISPECIES: dTMP kinase [unclassified Arthrobacter]PVE15266.1 thymidylate kinase [Arthrobacter sp. Bz4]
MIIVLTGIDGAGKTTAGQMLAQQLSAAEYPAVFTKNSSGRRSITAWCGRRKIKPPVRLLDTVETSIRCINVLISHLRARPGSRVVIMDRYLYCQAALRQARGLKSGWFLPFLSKALPTPDIVFYFDVPPDIAYSRIRRRAADTETLEHLHAFDEAYRELVEFPSFITIDASNPAGQLVEAMLQELGVCGLGLPS